MTELVTLAEPQSPGAEAYRVLRTNLAFAAAEPALRVLVVAAPAAGEGASLTAANLAVVTAQAGARVLLVDADLRRPAQGALFGLPDRAGLSTLLAGTDTEPELAATAVGGLSLLAAGPTPPNPAELLASPRLPALLERLRDGADIVIVDVPPVVAVTDAALVAPRADGVLLVLTAGRSRRDQTARARELLANVGARLLGVALIGAEDGRPGPGY